ncbi:DoxX family protein [Mycobacterium uberis]|uniref:DoxX family protein n=1 Tax=Mycobacterium uberis TaxID=2162698 RepID=UPI000E3037A4
MRLFRIEGGLLLTIGQLPRLASAALACIALPANLGVHTFWNKSDPTRKAQQRREFLADFSLLSRLMIASTDTASWRDRQAVERISEAVSSTVLDHRHRS